MRNRWFVDTWRGPWAESVCQRRWMHYEGDLTSRTILRLETRLKRQWRRSEGQMSEIKKWRANSRWLMQIGVSAISYLPSALRSLTSELLSLTFNAFANALGIRDTRPVW